MPCVLQDIGELRILRQEAVAGMDGISPGDLAGGDDLGDVEVAVGARRRADADRLIRETDVK